MYVANWDEENSGRNFRLGFDRAGRLIEPVVRHRDSGDALLVRAIKARVQYVHSIL